MEQGFAPSLEYNGFNILQAGKNFLEILKGHILELPLRTF